MDKYDDFVLVLLLSSSVSTVPLSSFPPSSSSHHPITRTTAHPHQRRTDFCAAALQQQSSLLSTSSTAATSSKPASSSPLTASARAAATRPCTLSRLMSTLAEPVAMRGLRFGSGPVRRGKRERISGCGDVGSARKRREGIGWRECDKGNEGGAGGSTTMI
jgi:hypothetical protein